MTLTEMIAELERRTTAAEGAARRRARGSRDELLAAFYRGAAANLRNAAAIEAEREAALPGTGEP